MTTRTTARVGRSAAALASGLAMLAATPTDASAADGPSAGGPAGGGLDEIVVTARKRAETLQEVPLSVTAFTSERLQDLNLTDLGSIQRFTPGLSFEQSAFNASYRYLPQIRFRGMSTNAPQANAQVGAVFMDGIFVVGGAQSLSTEDVERVEVLKGPQNTYFGRNTFGGAINFVTKAPADTFGASIRTQVEQRDTYRASASVEGPLMGDVVTGRLTFTKYRDGAHYKSSDGGDVGRQETQYGTGTLAFKLLDAKLNVKLRAHVQSDSDYGNANFTLRTSAQLANCRPNVTAWYCGGLPSVGDSVRRLDGSTVVVPNNGLEQDTNMQPAQLVALGRGDALYNFLSNANGAMNDIPFYGDLPKLDHFGAERRIRRYAANWSYDFANEMQLAGNVGYAEMRFAGLTDFDATVGVLPTAALPVYLYVPMKSSDLSAEIRLVSAQQQRLRWLVGANMFKLRFDGSTGSAVKTVNERTGLVNTNPWQNSDRDRSEVRGFFAAVSFDVIPTVTVDLEARYQIDELKAFQQTAPNQFLPIFREFKDVLPRGIVSWKPTPATNLYASWSRGALPGIANSTFENQINQIAANPNNAVGSTDKDVIRAQLSGLAGTPIPLTLDSEQVDQIEVGVKQEFLGGRAFVNLAGYQLEWTNQKASVTAIVANARLPNGRIVPANGDLNGDGLADNIAARIPGQSRIRGIEAEAGFRPIDPLTLTFGAEWTDSEYRGRFPSGALVTAYSGITNLAGRYLFMYPKSKLSLTGRWEAPFGTADRRWYAQAAAAYTGKIYTDEANLSWVDPYTLVNAAVGVTLAGLNVELYGNNLTNYDGWLNGRRNSFADNTQVMAMVPARKRVAGLRLNYTF
jgi:iron complex outermembrane receptor protein